MPRCFFFFQAEDGIRDLTVTGVQTCALPICSGRPAPRWPTPSPPPWPGTGPGPSRHNRRAASLLSTLAGRLPLAEVKAPVPYAIAGFGAADAELAEVARTATVPDVIKLQRGMALVMG